MAHMGDARGSGSTAMVAPPAHTVERRREPTAEPVFVGRAGPQHGSPLALVAERDPARDAERARREHAERLAEYRALLVRRPDAVEVVWGEFVQRWVDTVVGSRTADVALPPAPPVAAAVWLIDLWDRICTEHDAAERIWLMAQANTRMTGLLSNDPRAAAQDAGCSLSTVARLFGLDGLPPNRSIRASDLPLSPPGESAE